MGKRLENVRFDSNTLTFGILEIRGSGKFI